MDGNDNPPGDQLMPTSFLMGLMRALQRESDMSDYEAAKRAGVTQTYLSQLRDGINRDPSFDKVVRLSIAYGVPIERFVDPEVEQHVRDQVKVRIAKHTAKARRRTKAKARKTRH